MDALNSVCKIFETTTVRSIILPDNDPLHSTICQLAPWEIVRIQIARVPAQRRFPIDITYTHRGAAIEYQDGNISIEAEALDGHLLVWIW